MHQHSLTLPYLTLNATRWVPILIALVNGKNPAVRWLIFSIKVETICTTRGMRKEEITFFYGKTPTLSWDPNWWQWMDGSRFLNYTTKFGSVAANNTIPNESRVVDKWQGYLPRNYRFCWSQVWDPLRLHKEITSFASFGKRQLWSMNGGHTSLRRPFPNNVFYCLLTRVNCLSTSVGIVSELGVLGGGPPSSCMNYTWLGSAIMKAFNGNKPSLLKGFQDSLPKS